MPASYPQAAADEPPEERRENNKGEAPFCSRRDTDGAAGETTRVRGSSG